MCKFCDHEDCKLIKQQVIERGPIFEINAGNIMRLATDETPQTYSFKGVSSV